MEKITALRAIMKEHGIGAYIIPSTDEWRNEYTPIHKRRLQWICGFSGSNGVLIITENKLILFTDGRYTLQAKIELGDDYTVVDMYNPSGCEAMASCKGLVIGYDPMIQTLSEIEYYEKLGKRFKFSMKCVEENLVDVLMLSDSNVNTISKEIASELCREIIGSLPEYFGIAEVNESYIEGVKNCTNIAIRESGRYIGMLSLAFQYKNNGKIFWMGVLPEFQNKGYGSILINSAEALACKLGFKTISVETLSPSHTDENYLQTYNFYLSKGFMPLFDLQPQDYEWQMVYMIKSNLSGKLQSHTSNIKTLPLEITGMSTEDKIIAVTEKTPGESDYLVLTSLASICWLLNIRGNDIPYNPMVLCYMILEIKTKKIHLFVNTSKLLDISNITIHALDSFKDHIKGLKNCKIAFDKKNSPIWLTQNIANGIDVEDPAVILKAMKNPVELEGFRKAHRYDGVALCKFWFWFHENLEKGFDEVSAAERLTEFRRENPSFVEENFSTISGYGSNGAIVHYGPKKGFCKSIPSPGEDPIYLVDSGGHYDCAGTTDITRMFNLGGATDEHKNCYTAVLRGHIALAKAIFPEGTSGAQLDALARYYLWQIGLDYSHGTGHGVGHFLSVHEGPHGITKRNTVPLRENMIVSIEPGYYKEGHFGMRIENLYAIKKSSEFPGFLEFDLLSMVPIETSLINFNDMTQDDIEWLKKHNRVALEAVKKNLTPEELKFVYERVNVK